MGMIGFAAENLSLKSKQVFLLSLKKGKKFKRQQQSCVFGSSVRLRGLTGHPAILS